MRLDKEKAFKLRMQGRSYGEIQALLGISKATLSAWFSGIELSDQAQERIAKRTQQTTGKALAQRNNSQSKLAEQKAQATRLLAKKEVGKLAKRDLFMAGISLYWAEGYKRPRMVRGKIRTSHAVSLTNSDPELIRIFLAFLREVCKVSEERITANLRIQEAQNKNYLLEFWSKTTRIPHSRFQTFLYKPRVEKQQATLLPYGTIQVRVNSTELYHKIMGWIDGLQLTKH